VVDLPPKALDHSSPSIVHVLTLHLAPGFVNIDEINAWVTSEEACERLGVRPQTLYAYVSRGRLLPRKDGRRSLFSVDELDGLATRAGRGSRTARLEVLIDTELTLLDRRGRLFYRGVDVAEVATQWSFERTAEWLWSGKDGEPPAWQAPDDWAARARVAGGHRPADRLRAGAAAIAAGADRSMAPPADVGRQLVPALVEAWPVVRVGKPARIAGIERDGSIAARAWCRLSPLSPTPPRLAALNAALVLLADHELAVSAVAARVAASAWAPPLDVVVAALAAHGGALHGGVTSAVEHGLRCGGDVSMGFGHRVYEGDDPRATALLDVVWRAATASGWRPIAEALRVGDHPNVDFSLAALAVAFDMVDGAAEGIFALARVAGWLAHAAEEYGRPFRFRPRASYVGVPPLD
jgi:citrate synthase